ncbi:MAG: radical SAM protein [Candidatus Omnitrophota bacterium]|nr:radical SAM protein [Candidatus Omnitrophota bacterium]
MSQSAYVSRQVISKAGFREGTKPLLSRLDIELTERCNNNCLHCYINLPQDDLEAKNKELSTDEIKNILKEAVSLGCLTVRFTGGEPLLRADFEELYLFARRLGLKVLLFTNATLITGHLAELFFRIPPLEKIEVSVYGMKKTSYEAVTRAPGSFEAAFRGINLLLEKHIPFVVKGALLPSNKVEIGEFENWAVTSIGMDNPPSYAMFFDLRCRRETKKNELIKSLRVSSEEGLKVLIREQDKYLKGMREFCSKFARPGGDLLFTCGAGCDGGCVDAYGNFQACMMLRHPRTVYDLKNGSLRDGLTNFFPVMREMRTDSREYLIRCACCFLKGLCEQCPAKSWMEYGTIDTPVKYLCEIAHSQARFLGLLNDGEKAWEIRDWKERIGKFMGKKAYS